MIKSYWDKRKNRIGRIAAGEDIVWISEYPKNLLAYPAESVNAGLHANDYDIAANAFSGYKDIYDLYLDATGGRRQLSMTVGLQAQKRCLQYKQCG